MKLGLIIGAIAFFGMAQSAEAAILVYDLQGSDSSKWSATFTLDTEADPSVILTSSVRYNGVPIDFTRPNSSVVENAAFPNTGVTFRTVGNQGGFFLGNLGGFQSGFSVFGPQLFTGPTNSPQFLTGTFGLSDMSRVRTTDPLNVNYTLTVSEAAVTAAVPEPGTWAMMLLGFGAIGFGMRRRKEDSTGQRVRLSYT